MKKILLLLTLAVFALSCEAQFIFKNGKSTAKADTLASIADTLYLVNKTTGAKTKAVFKAGKLVFPDDVFPKSLKKWTAVTDTFIVIKYLSSNTGIGIETNGGVGFAIAANNGTGYQVSTNSGTAILLGNNIGTGISGLGAGKLIEYSGTGTGPTIALDQSGGGLNELYTKDFGTEVYRLDADGNLTTTGTVTANKVVSDSIDGPAGSLYLGSGIVALPGEVLWLNSGLTANISHSAGHIKITDPSINGGVETNLSDFLLATDTSALARKSVVNDSLTKKLGINATAANSNLLQGKDSIYIKANWIGGGSSDSSFVSIKVGQSGDTTYISGDSILKKVNGVTVFSVDNSGTILSEVNASDSTSSRVGLFGDATNYMYFGSSLMPVFIKGNKDTLTKFEGTTGYAAVLKDGSVISNGVTLGSGGATSSIFVKSDGAGGVVPYASQSEAPRGAFYKNEGYGLSIDTSININVTDYAEDPQNSITTKTTFGDGINSNSIYGNGADAYSIYGTGLYARTASGYNNAKFGQSKDSITLRVDGTIHIYINGVEVLKTTTDGYIIRNGTDTLGTGGSSTPMTSQQIIDSISTFNTLESPYKINFRKLRNTHTEPLSVTSDITITPDTANAIDQASTTFQLIGNGTNTAYFGSPFSSSNGIDIDTFVNTNGYMSTYLASVFGSGIYRIYKYSLIDYRLAPGAPITLDAPGSFNATGISEDSIVLSWNTVANASYYQLDSASTLNGTYATISSTIPQSVIGDTIAGLIDNHEVIFRIRSIGDGVNYLTSSWAIDSATTSSNQPPSFASVTLSGSANLDSTLTATANGYSDPESDTQGTTLWQWERSDNGTTGWADISGATSNTKVLVSADSAKYVRAGATPVAATGTSPGTEVFSSASAQVTSSVTIPTDGLIAYYKMASLLDETDNNNDGTIVGGVSLTTGRKSDANEAYDFNGTSGYITVADATSLDMTTAFTISVWINIDAVVTNNTIIAKWDYATQGGWAIQTFSPADEIQVYIANSLTDTGSNSIASTNFDLTTGWVHLVVVYDGSQSTNGDRVKIYKNASLRAYGVAGTIATSLQNNTATLKIGNFGGTLNRYFDGKIDDVRIYNRVLTQDEINSLYAE